MCVEAQEDFWGNWLKMQLRVPMLGQESPARS